MDRFSYEVSSKDRRVRSYIIKLTLPNELGDLFVWQDKGGNMKPWHLYLLKLLIPALKEISKHTDNRVDNEVIEILEELLQ
jgi:hypothetical protein